MIISLEVQFEFCFRVSKIKWSSTSFSNLLICRTGRPEIDLAAFSIHLGRVPSDGTAKFEVQTDELQWRNYSSLLETIIVVDVNPTAKASTVHLCDIARLILSVVVRTLCTSTVLLSNLKFQAFPCSTNNVLKRKITISNRLYLRELKEQLKEWRRWKESNGEKDGQCDDAIWPAA